MVENVIDDQIKVCYPLEGLRDIQIPTSQIIYQIMVVRKQDDSFVSIFFLVFLRIGQIF